MVDMTAEHPANEILAIGWYHVIYHYSLQALSGAIHPSEESKQSAWKTRVHEFLQNILNVSLTVWGLRLNLNGFEILMLFYILHDLY